MWLFEVRNRYGLTVLNYVATSNHIHLLVYADGIRMTIPRSMQLLAGRTAQEFNIRRKRRGAFWEDRYHATAVKTGTHLRRCMTYIDLNMVRAGAVKHPQEWECCGYNELQNAPRRYRRISRDVLARLLELRTADELPAWQQHAVHESLGLPTRQQRQPEWTESIAVGDEPYLAGVKAALGTDARHRAIHSWDQDSGVLREAPASYSAANRARNASPSLRNALVWRLGH